MVWTDNNLLIYIMVTPNLDALGCMLVGFNMKLDYLKGTDNKITYALSHARQKLDKETVTKLLNCAWNGNTCWAEADNINIIEEGEWVDQEIIAQKTNILRQHKKFHNLANSNLVKAQ